MWDDPAEADALFEKIRAHVPPVLNHDFEGGATEFPELNAAIISVRGSRWRCAPRVLQTDVVYEP